MYTWLPVPQELRKKSKALVAGRAELVQMDHCRRLETVCRHLAHNAATKEYPKEHMGPLAGVRVVEAAQIISGPFAGAMLADQGAEVRRFLYQTLGWWGMSSTCVT